MQSAVLRASAIGLGRVGSRGDSPFSRSSGGETRSTPFMTVSRLRTLVSRSATRGTPAMHSLSMRPARTGCRDRGFAHRQPPIGPGLSSRTARLDHSTTRRDARRAIRLCDRFSVRRPAVAARGLRAHADSPHARELVIGSLPERRQHKRQPAGRRSRWTERAHLPMASPCRTRPREPEARAVRPLPEPRSTIARSLGCGLFGRASRARS